MNIPILAHPAQLLLNGHNGTRIVEPGHFEYVLTHKNK
jgi:hypothetical protein|tara:strand:- start:415 stop:528 length:114 start_codon:yes stop_codon:yes gene_type:complete